MLHTDALGSEPGLWRYAAWLPVERPVVLGEVMTPLVTAPETNTGGNVSLKLEYLLPTGSFKDRGMAVLVSWLRQLDIRRVVNDSSGNAGASLAGYSARAGIECEVYAPQGNSSAKLAQIEAYGGTLVRVRGSRSAAQEAARRAAEQDVYATHMFHPFFLAGTETFAFELWEQTDGETPEAIVFPLGGGSLLLGAANGFRRLVDAGLTGRVPRLVGVQADLCPPLADAFESGARDPVRGGRGGSIAEGIMIQEPPRGRQVLEAVRATGGSITAVDDAAIEAARVTLGRAGFSVEPTSATAYAGLRKLRKLGIIRADERVVVALTGSGLKSADARRPRSVRP
ncbi:MAG: threonine synthase [Chloroflexi bacterium]|nr:threonine synthase [Chloroflexota bacterium]